jgi:hypothetical protein
VKKRERSVSSASSRRAKRLLTVRLELLQVRVGTLQILYQPIDQLLELRIILLEGLETVHKVVHQRRSLDGLSEKVGVLATECLELGIVLHERSLSDDR